MRWYNANKLLPKINQIVIVYCEELGVTIGECVRKRKIGKTWEVMNKNGTFVNANVTYWGKLPKKPKLADTSQEHKT